MIGGKEGKEEVKKKIKRFSLPFLLFLGGPQPWVGYDIGRRYMNSTPQAAHNLIHKKEKKKLYIAFNVLQEQLAQRNNPLPVDPPSCPSWYHKLIISAKISGRNLEQISGSITYSYDTKGCSCICLL